MRSAATVVTSPTRSTTDVESISTGTLQADTCVVYVNGIAVTFSPIIGSSGQTYGGSIRFQFTFNNPTSKGVFINANPSIALGTSTAGSTGYPAAASSTITYLTTVPALGQFAGDTATLQSPTTGAYAIPAHQARTFTYSGNLNNINGVSGLRVFRITNINYGPTATATLDKSLTSGIGTLFITAFLDTAGGQGSFLSYALTNPSATFTPRNSPNGQTTGGTVVFQFTLSNPGTIDYFVSGVPALAIGTSTVGSAGVPSPASSTITYLSTNPSVGQFAADTATIANPVSGAYVVPVGSSRVFTYYGSLDNTNGYQGLRVFRITRINLATTTVGTMSSSTATHITSGIQSLVVSPSLN